MSWLLGTLLFILGFVFSRLLYFFAASAISYKIMKAANLSALYLFVKSFERLVYYNTLSLHDYMKNDPSERNVEVYKQKLEEEMELFKSRCVGTLVSSTPSIFRTTAPFRNWTEAMVYLNENRDFVLQLMRENEND